MICKYCGNLIFPGNPFFDEVTELHDLCYWRMARGTEEGSLAAAEVCFKLVQKYPNLPDNTCDYILETASYY